ncbi:hypothetical protein FHG87_024030, partial [Trinorchestia longiramus]
TAWYSRVLPSLSPHCLVLTCPPLSPHRAGFAHVLGYTGSLQLLDDIRRAQGKKLETRYKRKKNSYLLKYKTCS